MIRIKIYYLTMILLDTFDSHQFKHVCIVWRKITWKEFVWDWGPPKICRTQPPKSWGLISSNFFSQGNPFKLPIYCLSSKKCVTIQIVVKAATTSWMGRRRWRPKVMHTRRERKSERHIYLWKWKWRWADWRSCRPKWGIAGKRWK